MFIKIKFNRSVLPGEDIVIRSGSQCQRVTNWKKIKVIITNLKTTKISLIKLDLRKIIKIKNSKKKIKCLKGVLYIVFILSYTNVNRA